MKVTWKVAPWERWTLSAIAAAVAFLGFAGIVSWREAHADPAVVRYGVAASGLGPPVTIAFMSDTHVNRSPFSSSVDPARLAHAVDLVNALRPDVVLLGGDYLATSGDEGDVPFAAAVLPFSRIRARLGVLGVIGNHDCQAPRHTVAVLRSGLAAAGVIPLVNENMNVGPIRVAGLDDLWCGSSDIAAAGRAVDGAGGRPVVLVLHNPDVFPLVPSGVSLTLAGHTHAGQIVPPVIGPVVSVSRYGHRYRYGEIVERGRRMIVSSGLGGLPFRWNAPPEIVLVTLFPRRP